MYNSLKSSIIIYLSGAWITLLKISIYLVAWYVHSSPSRSALARYVGWRY